MSSNSTVRWKDVAAVYPTPEEIAKALQDTGKKKKKKHKGNQIEVTNYPLVDKLCLAVYKNIVQHINQGDGLTTKNASRGKVPLVKFVIHNRKHVDISDTDVFFHQFGKGGKVYLLADNKKTCGIDLAIDAFQDYVGQSNKQKNVARTNVDGLRLACIMLDPKHRAPVSKIMTGKKDARKSSDQSGDTTLHWFEEAVKDDFLNAEYECAFPNSKYYEDFDEEDKASWDPNHFSIFEHDRDGSWLKGTWDDYLKLKYRAALNRWNKWTGGGGGDPTRFVDYCQGDRWLVWVFCLDLEANFLLASNAGGRMPRHLQVESGFEEEASSLSGNNESALDSTRAAMDGELERVQETRKKLDTVFDKVVDMVSKKDTTTVGDGDIEEQVFRYSDMMTNQKHLDSMTPDSKAVYVGRIEKKRKALIQKMKEQDQLEQEQDD